MSKILILGKGFVGNYLNKRLSFKNKLHISKKDLDYSDYNTFFNFLKEHKYPAPEEHRIDHVINCSGYTGSPNVDACEDNKESCYHYNVTVPLYLTEACNRLHIPITHIGSGCIYSGYDKFYSEDDAPNFGADCHYSSFYSKTKDAFEKLSARFDRSVLRIRMPFCEEVNPKNYINKLLNYDTLISKPNSLTSLYDLSLFVDKFISNGLSGVYNIVNDGCIDSIEITRILKNYGVENPNWKFVSIKDLSTKTQRSNCILSTEKIQKNFGKLPNVTESLEWAIKYFAENLKKQ